MTIALWHIEFQRVACDATTVVATWCNDVAIAAEVQRRILASRPQGALEVPPRSDKEFSENPLNYLYILNLWTFSNHFTGMALEWHDVGWIGFLCELSCCNTTESQQSWSSSHWHQGFCICRRQWVLPPTTTSPKQPRFTKFTSAKRRTSQDPEMPRNDKVGEGMIQYDKLIRYEKTRQNMTKDHRTWPSFRLFLWIPFVLLLTSIRSDSPDSRPKNPVGSPSRGGAGPSVVAPTSLPQTDSPHACNDF